MIFIFLSFTIGLHISCFLGSLTQVIRNFAKNLESSLQAGMQDVPVAMIDAKVFVLCVML